MIKNPKHSVNNIKLKKKMVGAKDVPAYVSHFTIT